MIRLRWQIVLCACAMIPTGCHDESSDRMDDVAGVEEWTLEEVARIGSLDDPEQALTRVSAVRIGPDGKLFVAQPMENVIRVFNRTGDLVRTIGGRGEGPGEFSGLSSIGFIGDTLFASDNRLGRVSFFGWDGEFLVSVRWVTEEVRVPAGLLLPTPPQVVLRDGGGLVEPGSAVPIGPTGAPAGELEVPYLRMDRTAGVTDTLGWRRIEFASATVMVDGTEVVLWSPFQELPRFVLMPDGSGLVVVDDESGTAPPRFRVTLIDPAGDTAWSRTVEYEPLAMVDSAVQAAVADLHEMLQRRPPPHPTTEQIERGLRAEGMIPETVAPVSHVVGGQDGSIWIGREDLAEERVRWDVFNPEGERMARVQLPREAVVVTAVEGAVVTLEPDELEVPYLMWYELHR